LLCTCINIYFKHSSIILDKKSFIFVNKFRFLTWKKKNNCGLKGILELLSGPQFGPMLIVARSKNLFHSFHLICLMLENYSNLGLMWYTNRYLTFIMAKYMYFYFKPLFNRIIFCVYVCVIYFECELVGFQSLPVPYFC
jgi:hypothetical protein